MSNLKFSKKNNLINSNTKTYKILVVDDEQSIHDITNLALKAMDFPDFNLEILAAYSSKEAKEILHNNDVALALVDVIMETPEAGLELVDYIRKEMKNNSIRIIIRTGQANQFPAIDIIQKYDINDFKEKTELTIERLFTTVRSSVKQYIEIMKIQNKYEETYKQMTTNPLTKLPNRTKLHEDCDDSAINRTLILIDIVGFSAINESSGYTAGNIVLKELGGFLQSMYSDVYNVYHLDNDLFALVSIAENLCTLIESVESIKDDISKLNIVTNNFNKTIDTTIGVACQSENTLIRKAELALKEARETGKNKIMYYSDDLKIIKRLNNIHKWGPIIKNGLINGNMKAYYQPIYNLSNNKIDKYELLVRIEHEGKIYSPIDFLEVANYNGQMYDIFKFMFKEACIQAKKSKKKFSINIGDSEFHNDDLLNFIKDTTKAHNINPNLLSLEILEYNSISQDTDIKDTILQIHKLGIEIVIDDFGTQCSNFGQIENLPIDTIKIDGSYIKDLPTNRNSQIVVKTIKTFAKEKNIKLVAEFVCSKEVLNAVKEFEIDFAQGYHLGMPSPSI